MNSPVQLKTYNNSWYSPGRSILWQAAWLFFGQPVFRCSLLPFSGLRVTLLRCFGAEVGKRVVIHSGVSVKYPWHLFIGDDCWIGEHAWIDCLTSVRLEDNVCISQGCYICTGNHDWSDPSFGLIVRPVTLKSGSWAAAKSVLMPGATLGEGAVAGAGSVVSHAIPPFEVHTGNPAGFTRMRQMHTAHTAVHAGEQVAQ